MVQYTQHLGNTRARSFGCFRSAIVHDHQKKCYPVLNHALFSAGEIMRIIFLIVCVSMVSTAFAGDDEDIDYKKSDFATTLMEHIFSAGQGDASAKIKLGDMYAHGQGVKADPKEALKWYRLAAGHGDPNVQYDLGVKCSSGQGVPQDYTEAMKWFRLSADQGNVNAQYNLGVLYASGKGAKRDYKEAVKWFGMAANLGYARAQYNLGVLYAKGRGVDKPNRVVAYALYDMIASKDETIDNLIINTTKEKLAEKMSFEEINEAKTLAKELSKSNSLLSILDKYIKNNK